MEFSPYQHNCPECGARCNCDVIAKGIRVDDDGYSYEEECTHCRPAPSRLSRFAKYIRVIDAIVTVVIVASCFSFGVYLAMDRDKWPHAAVILMLISIWGILANISRKL